MTAGYRAIWSATLFERQSPSCACPKTSRSPSEAERRASLELDHDKKGGTSWTDIGTRSFGRSTTRPSLWGTWRGQGSRSVD